MNDRLELYGLSTCPFAWRTRLAAKAKSVEFDWIAFDAESPDPRSGANNPNKRSPLCKHGDFTFVESGIIALYIEEAFPGRALQPSEPRARAVARLAIAELGALTVHPGQEPAPETVTKVSAALELLEKRLQALTTPWLAGAEPGLADHLVWSGLGTLRARNIEIPAALERARRYADAAREHADYKATAPPYAL